MCQTDGQTDGQTSCQGIVRAMHMVISFEMERLVDRHATYAYANVVL